MSFANTRLTKELTKLNGDNSLDGVEISTPNDIRNWIASIDGPEDTPYQNYKFKSFLNIYNFYRL